MMTVLHFLLPGGWHQTAVVKDQTVIGRSAWDKFEEGIISDIVPVPENERLQELQWVELVDGKNGVVRQLWAAVQLNVSQLGGIIQEERSYLRGKWLVGPRPKTQVTQIAEWLLDHQQTVQSVLEGDRTEPLGGECPQIGTVLGTGG